MMAYWNEIELDEHPELLDAFREAVADIGGDWGMPWTDSSFAVASDAFPMLLDEFMVTLNTPAPHYHTQFDSIAVDLAPRNPSDIVSDAGFVAGWKYVDRHTAMKLVIERWGYGVGRRRGRQAESAKRKGAHCLEACMASSISDASMAVSTVPIKPRDVQVGPKHYIVLRQKVRAMTRHAALTWTEGEPWTAEFYPGEHARELWELVETLLEG